MTVAIACRTPEFWRILESVGAPGEFIRIERPEDLRLDHLLVRSVDTIFFVHWSWIVPSEILERVECVCFHSAPVPYGRGGSPIQNMIARGFKETEIVALRMESTLDSGPVYARERCSLVGGGEEVMLRIYEKIVEMIASLHGGRAAPVAQEGEVVQFRRRKPEESRLPVDATIGQLFDHIRMLDIEGYPQAFVDLGKFKLVFSRPALRFGGKIEATVVIEAIKGENEPS